MILILLNQQNLKSHLQDIVAKCFFFTKVICHIFLQLLVAYLQGSNLAPLLFSLFVKDLSLIVTSRYSLHFSELLLAKQWQTSKWFLILLFGSKIKLYELIAHIPHVYAER